MLERLVLTVVIIALGIAAYRLYGWAVLRRSGVGLLNYKIGSPAIVYFTDPGCAPCLAVQDPALEELASQVGDAVQIIKVQALERPDLANAWGVLSLPTTFVIDSKGRPRRVNHGVAKAQRLLDQLRQIGELSIDRSERVEKGRI